MAEREPTNQGAADGEEMEPIILLTAEAARLKIIDENSEPIFSRASWGRALQNGSIASSLINGRRFVSMATLMALIGGGC